MLLFVQPWVCKVNHVVTSSRNAVPFHHRIVFQFIHPSTAGGLQCLMASDDGWYLHPGVHGHKPLEGAHASGELLGQKACVSSPSLGNPRQFSPAAIPSSPAVQESSRGAATAVSLCRLQGYYFSVRSAFSL